MTPSEACALLKRHRESWPKWMTGPIDATLDANRGVTILLLRSELGCSRVALGWSSCGAVVARTRPGLSDEENVRRILAAAEKGYRQRQRQIEKQRQRKPMKRAKSGRPNPDNMRVASVHIKQKPMKRLELKRVKSRLRPNRKRKAKRFEEDFGGKDHAEWGRMRPCDVDGRIATPGMPNHNHHEPSRGAGGKAADQVTLCPHCHASVHAHGRDSFEEVWDVNLRELAAKRYQEWLDQGGHELPSGLEKHGESR